MKTIIKNVFFWTFILLLGIFLLIAPQYVCVFAKNYMVSRENANEVQKENFWVYNNQGRRYVSGKGSFVHDTSQEIDGVTYYFDSKGYVQTGWLQEQGKLYHRNSDGSATTGWFEDENGKYYLNEDGSPTTGWADLDGKKYYFSSSGVMEIGRAHV